LQSIGAGKNGNSDDSQPGGSQKQQSFRRFMQNYGSVRFRRQRHPGDRLDSNACRELEWERMEHSNNTQPYGSQKQHPFGRLVRYRRIMYRGWKIYQQLGRDSYTGRELERERMGYSDYSQPQ
jgi:hypothetical protein